MSGGLARFWDRRSAFARELIRGVAITVLLVAGKLYFEHTELGRRFELLGFEFLQSRMSAFQDKARLPVLVVDISGIRGGRGEVTPRAELEQLIEAISKDFPRAIAVDIDFSPNENGPRSDDDREFFEFCARKSQRVPILLGVYGARDEGPDVWLAWPEYRNLAASIAIPLEGSNRVTTRTTRWTSPRNGTEPLPVMGPALASAYLKTVPRPVPSAFVRLLAEVPDYDATPSRDNREFLVNYSKLAQLQHEMIATRTPASVAEFKSFYQGRMVILGDASEDASTDKFKPPIGGTVPGVYFHAASAYTFGVEPLYELKVATRLLLDLLVVAPILVVAWLRHRPRRAGAAADRAYHAMLERIDLFYGAVVMAVVVLAGAVLVGRFNIMWTDFVLVMLALPIHRYVERVVKTVG